MNITDAVAVVEVEDLLVGAFVWVWNGFLGQLKIFIGLKTKHIGTILSIKQWSFKRTWMKSVNQGEHLLLLTITNF